MEVELGLKLTRAADDFMSDFHIAKDRTGPLFLSRETDAMFFLTAHLKGYTRQNIKIDINKEGTIIEISGERQVRETVMVGWKVIKKDTETREFKKIFRIPDGVVLDNIKANFNDDESILKIEMPKRVEGVIHGSNIEEIKEGRELVGRLGSSSLEIGGENGKNNAGTSDRENGARGGVIGSGEKTGENEKRVEREGDDIRETGEDEEEEDVGENDIREENEGFSEINRKIRVKKCKMCIPIVAGSALLLSFVVFICQMIRSKNQISRRRD